MSKESILVQFQRAAAVRYAWAFIGLPYIWGGDDPIRGFDCSGFVIEALKSVGVLPHSYDNTANGLYVRYSAHAVPKGHHGCLVFWFNAQGLAIHVELMIDELHVLGASGGGSSTTSVDAAAAQNAFVKRRPIDYRGAGYKIVDPFTGGSDER